MQFNPLHVAAVEARMRINPHMELSEAKDFATYVMERQHVFDDAIQQAWRDLYTNFREDAGYDD
jgi:hypothetical protein